MRNRNTYWNQLQVGYSPHQICDLLLRLKGIWLSRLIHCIDNDWVLKKKSVNFRPGPPPHNGPNLAERVIHLLKEWGIDKKKNLLHIG